jgi:hypothetical protein
MKKWKFSNTSFLLITASALNTQTTELQGTVNYYILIYGKDLSQYYE